VHRSRKIAATFVAVLATVALSACGDDSGSGDSGAEAVKKVEGISVAPKTLAILDVSGASQGEQLVQEMAKKAAALLGWEYTFVDGQGDPQKITKGAATIVSQKPDAFISLSVEAAQIRPQLIEMQKQGILTCEAGGGQQRDELFNGQFGEDEFKLGQLIGETILKTNPSPKIIVLANPQNFAGTERERGLAAALEGSPAEIVFRQVIDFADPAGSATKAVTNGLAKFPDANIVYPVFDFSLPPALQVINQKRSDAKIVGHYTNDTTVTELRKPGSPLAAVVDTDEYKGVAYCMDEFLKEFEGKGEFNENAVEEAGGYLYNVVTPDNVDELVPEGETLQFASDPLLAPFIEKWEKEYPAK
jgi:ABC-type sugar transport system substrate-binding protein